MKAFPEVCLAVAWLGLAAAATASPTIELKDGSRIEGEIQRIDGGVYTVLSPSIGTVHVAESNIVRIVYGDTASSAADSSGKSSAHDDALAGEIRQLETRLAQDPADMQSIMSLQSDPQIQAILSDPAIIRHGLWTAAKICQERNFPLQLHVGFGDPDVYMHACDPTHFTDFLRNTATWKVAVGPHRESGAGGSTCRFPWLEFPGDWLHRSEAK